MADLNPWDGWGREEHYRLQELGTQALWRTMVSSVLLAKTVDQEVSLTMEVQGFILEAVTVRGYQPGLWVNVSTAYLDPEGETFLVCQSDAPVNLDEVWSHAIQYLLDRFIPGETNPKPYIP